MMLQKLTKCLTWSLYFKPWRNNLLSQLQPCLKTDPTLRALVTYWLRVMNYGLARLQHVAHTWPQYIKKIHMLRASAQSSAQHSHDVFVFHHHVIWFLPFLWCTTCNAILCGSSLGNFPARRVWRCRPPHAATRISCMLDTGEGPLGEVLQNLKPLKNKRKDL